MKPTELLPYFHPTSVAVVDDDSVFVESLTFRFGDKWNCEPFVDPKRALEFFRNRGMHQVGADRFLTQTSMRDEEAGNELVGFRSAEIAAIMAEHNRFSEISVVLVDYEMPSMTGLELCDYLADSPVKKILLTGKAGQDVAISAFNASIIDAYVQKQSPDLGAEIEAQVERLQADYFAQTTSAIAPVHVLGGGSYLADPVFTIMMQRLIRERSVVEYYALSNPCGIYLGHANGSGSFVRILDEDEHRSQCEVARLNNAPMELVHGLDEGAFVPCFPTPSGFYETAVQSMWRDYVFPAHFLHGREPWRYGLLNADRLNLGQLGDVVSYAEYLNRRRH